MRPVGWGHAGFVLITQASTFRNIKEATGFINEVLSDASNRAVIEAVANGREQRAILEKQFNRTVGHGYVVDAPAHSIRPRPGRPRRIEMTAIRLLIRYDPEMPNGFRVQTAFPIVSPSP